MALLSVKQTAWSLGIVFAVLHALWGVVVAAGYAQQLIELRMGQHFLSVSTSVLPFNVVTAIISVVVAFVCGAVLGWLFATVWNWTGKNLK